MRSTIPPRLAILAGSLALAGFVLVSTRAYCLKTSTVAASVDRSLGLPPLYDWQTRHDWNTGGDYHYAIDPESGETLYVGPDGIFYIFAHPPPITPSDLQSRWLPRAPQMGLP